MASSPDPTGDWPDDLSTLTDCQLDQAIKQLDTDLVHAFMQRARLVMAQQRDVSGWGADTAKSNQLIEETVAGHIGPGDPVSRSDAAELLKHIANICRQSIPDQGVAYLGPKHSYSHQATLKYFGDGAELKAVPTIGSVFEAVHKGDSPMGVVPIENSTDGRIVDTLEGFVHQQTSICGEVLLPIHHNLLSQTPLEQITEIHSKPQAISQCRNWISRYAPTAKLIEARSTVAAAETATSQPGVAAIASAQAGHEYGLEVIGKNIEDNPHNVTRFAVLGNHHPQPTGDDKTTLLFQLDHQPGALADSMLIFKEAELNLTWIESFPAPGVPNEYFFFVEFSGHRDEPRPAQAINKLSEASQKLVCLGSFRRGQ